MKALDKINTLLLCDIAEHLGIEGDVNVGFVRAAIQNGHTWAIEQRYGSDRSESDEERKPVVQKVHDVMHLWTVLEDAYEQLNAAEKAELEVRVPHVSKDVRWGGFDGNNESEYMSVLAFMVGYMDFYPNFRGREHLNSHMPTLETFERMWAAYQPIRDSMPEYPLELDDLTTILSARVHPSRR
ncbi:hypothetical protein CA606_12200 [Caulobacter vibrioides]|uniref:YfbU family protein n=1 Tax=Caulobacter vibrioides TaxID=155892 RepID=A0A290MLS9_CAUVI|nr:YfbU family protein [Caulobacter vibrioides]ATC33026.1 hypothetical protein CA606_12200 [Caulobacter vibrioides]